MGEGAGEARGGCIPSSKQTAPHGRVQEHARGSASLWVWPEGRTRDGIKETCEFLCYYGYCRLCCYCGCCYFVSTAGNGFQKPEWSRVTSVEILQEAGGGEGPLSSRHSRGPGARVRGRGLGERDAEGGRGLLQRSPGGGLGGRQRLRPVRLSVAAALRTEEERVPACPRSPGSPRSRDRMEGSWVQARLLLGLLVGPGSRLRREDLRPDWQSLWEGP